MPAAKRKSDVLAEPVIELTDSEGEEELPAPVAKKARKSDVGEGSSTGGKKGKAASAAKNWYEIELEGEEEGGVQVYDDCNEIRRKIRLLQKQPDFKVTHWLKEIGNINNNSYQRFMKATGPTGGASNGTYYAAYVYFEKVRIAEGKKKTAKRLRNEQEHSRGMPTEERRHMWVLG